MCNVSLQQQCKIESAAAVKACTHTAATHATHTHTHTHTQRLHTSVQLISG